MVKSEGILDFEKGHVKVKTSKNGMVYKIGKYMELCFGVMTI